MWAVFPLARIASRKGRSAFSNCLPHGGFVIIISLSIMGILSLLICWLITLADFISDSLIKLSFITLHAFESDSKNIVFLAPATVSYTHLRAHET